MITNEEAIKKLKSMIHDDKRVYGDKPKQRNEALDLAIKALEDRPQGKWIPVSERLPQIRDWYLGIFKEPDTGYIIDLPFICDYVGDITKGTTNEGWILRGLTDIDNPSEYYRNLECIYWQPLPIKPNIPDLGGVRNETYGM